VSAKAKHTPGPWIATDLRQVKTESNFHVALIAGSDFSVGIETANAQLIAAAPDLLDVSLAVMAMFDGLFAQCLSNPIQDSWGKPVDLTLINQAHSLARAAIAKATGERA
jgi:hypothetical protein